MATTPRPSFKIELQLKIVKDRFRSLKPESKQWYALKGKITNLEKELVASKQFEYLAK